MNTDVPFRQNSLRYGISLGNVFPPSPSQDFLSILHDLLEWEKRQDLHALYIS